MWEVENWIDRDSFQRWVRQALSLSWKRRWVQGLGTESRFSDPLLIFIRLL